MYINFLYVKSLVFKIESASSINYLIFDNFLPIKRVSEIDIIKKKIYYTKS